MCSIFTLFSVSACTSESHVKPGEQAPDLHELLDRLHAHLPRNTPLSRLQRLTVRRKKVEIHPTLAALLEMLFASDEHPPLHSFLGWLPPDPPPCRLNFYLDSQALFVITILFKRATPVFVYIGCHPDPASVTLLSELRSFISVPAILLERSFQAHRQLNPMICSQGYLSLPSGCLEGFFWGGMVVAEVCNSPDMHEQRKSCLRTHPTIGSRWEVPRSGGVHGNRRFRRPGCCCSSSSSC